MICNPTCMHCEAHEAVAFTLTQWNGANNGVTVADFSSLMPVGDKVYQISHFETVPAATYLTTLSQDKRTGELTVDSTKCASWCRSMAAWFSALHRGSACARPCTCTACMHTQV